MAMYLFTAARCAVVCTFSAACFLCCILSLLHFLYAASFVPCAAAVCDVTSSHSATLMRCAGHCLVLFLFARVDAFVCHVNVICYVWACLRSRDAHTVSAGSASVDTRRVVPTNVASKGLPIQTDDCGLRASTGMFATWHSGNTTSDSSVSSVWILQGWPVLRGVQLQGQPCECALPSHLIDDVEWATYSLTPVCRSEKQVWAHG